MITKCPYCDYRYPDEPLSLDIMKVTLEKDLPPEDYFIWLQRLIETSYKNYGFKSYRGTQIHVGRMHKGRMVFATHEFNEAEKAILNA